jgi:site-specific recombinase XerD
MKLSEVVDQFLIDCEIRGLTGETLSWYRKRLGVFTRKLEEVCHVIELEGVKITHLRQFVQHLMGTKSGANNPRVPTQEKPLSAFTVRGYVRVIKVLFTWCLNEELIEKNPTARLGEPLRVGGVKSILEDVKTKSGLTGVRVSAHTFRHTFAKFYLQRGGEVFKLSREMGHSTVQVTEIYLKDFRSSEAWKEHTEFSPIGEINLRSKKKHYKEEVRDSE